MVNNGAVHGDGLASFIAKTAMPNLYRVVKLDSDRNTVALATAVTDRGFGIIQQTAEADEAVAVKVSGFSLATIGAGNWTKGAYLTPAADGTLIATTTGTDLVCAIAMEAGNAGEEGEIEILPYAVPQSQLV